MSEQSSTTTFQQRFAVRVARIADGTLVSYDCLTPGVIFYDGGLDATWYVVERLHLRTLRDVPEAWVRVWDWEKMQPCGALRRVFLMEHRLYSSYRHLPPGLQRWLDGSPTVRVQAAQVQS